MNRNLAIVLALTAFISLPAVVWATTAAELEPTAVELRDELNALADRQEAGIEDELVLEAEYEVLGDELVLLTADRDRLDPNCDCAALDSLLQEAGDVADVLAANGGWGQWENDS